MTTSRHVTEQQMELYSLGTLPEPDVEPLEEHLLVCEACQDLLEETDAYVSAMRAAAQDLRSEPGAVRRAWSERFGWLRHPWAALALAGAAVCILFLLMLLWPRLLGPPTVPATVILEAARGDVPGGPVAAAGKPVRLRLDLTGLASPALLRLELADASGARVAGSEVTPRNDAAVWDLAPVAAGRYWVRVYEPGQGGKLLREFALPVR